MPDNYAALQRQRSETLDQMATLDRMERGRLCEQFLKGTKDGKPVSWGPYHVLQRRLGQKVLKERVPADRLPTIQADIQRHELFLKLADRYAELTEAMTHLQNTNPALKKKPKPSRPMSSKRPRPS
jgi:hypothetical protein